MKAGRLMEKKRIICDNGRRNDLFYYLTEEGGTDHGYGIMVIKMDGEQMEVETSGKLTMERGIAIHIIAQLAKNIITPICLCEVLYDAKNILGENNGENSLDRT